MFRCTVWSTLFLLISTPVLAQVELVEQQLRSIQGTLSVQYAPQMADGRLMGCSLIYEVLQQDRVYLSGNYLRVSGGISLMAAEGKIGLTLKVVAAEIDPSLPELVAGSLAPDRVYLVMGDLSSNFESLVASHPSDTPGGIFAIYQLEPGINAIFQAMETNTITLGIGLSGGSMDIQMPVELDVVDVAQDGSRTRSPESMLSFISCTQQLMERMVP